MVKVADLSETPANVTRIHGVTNEMTVVFAFTVLKISLVKDNEKANTDISTTEIEIEPAIGVHFNNQISGAFPHRYG
jgi:hypothetical protein